MTATGRNLVVGGVVAVLIALFVAWWLHTFERATRIIDLPPRGEAGYNPLYALRLALRAEGIDVVTRQRLQFGEVPLGAHDTVLVLNDPRTLSQPEVDGLLAWVQGGGHLLVRTPPLSRDIAASPSALLDALKIQPLPRQNCLHADSHDGETVVHVAEAKNGKPGKDDDNDASRFFFCSGASFTMLGVEPVLSWGDLGNGYGYARLAHGEGTVDVVADFDFASNDQLENATGQDMARQLLQPGWRQGRVHLVYAASMPPLWRLLFDRAPMAWLPMLLALLAWLWMRTQRFGPLLPSPEPGRRALLEHVQASGEHLWRYGRAPLLHAAMRDAFLARLRRRDAMAATLDGAAQASAIAARTGVPEADVAYALQTPRPNDGADFRLRIARLIQLRKRT